MFFFVLCYCHVIYTISFPYIFCRKSSHSFFCLLSLCVDLFPFFVSTHKRVYSSEYDEFDGAVNKHLLGWFSTQKMNSRSYCSNDSRRKMCVGISRIIIHTSYEREPEMRKLSKNEAAQKKTIKEWRAPRHTRAFLRFISVFGFLRACVFSSGGCE